MRQGAPANWIDHLRPDIARRIAAVEIFERQHNSVAIGLDSGKPREIERRQPSASFALPLSFVHLIPSRWKVGYIDDKDDGCDPGWRAAK
jgi:hypothetical protein